MTDVSQYLMSKLNKTYKKNFLDMKKWSLNNPPPMHETKKIDLSPTQFLSLINLAKDPEFIITKQPDGMPMEDWYRHILHKTEK